MKKPANLVYGADEEPPIAITVVSAIQHVGVIAIFMIYPLIIAREAGSGAASWPPRSSPGSIWRPRCWR
jgi:NCS2 family nucleobase:cation symporter-2